MEDEAKEKVRENGESEDILAKSIWDSPSFDLI
jgi:hypothetical protein